MTFTRWLRIAIPVALAVCARSALAQRDNARWLDQCRDNDRGWNDRYQYCEIRESGMRGGGGARVTADGGRNGGVAVGSWDRDSVAIVARIQTWARSETEAKTLAGTIRIVSDGRAIRAEGPSPSGDDGGWSVSFDLLVPTKSDLSIHTQNGGISVVEVEGTMDLSAQNGGLHLQALGGDVRAETRNGGLDVTLSGSRWEGKGLDAETTNGGIRLRVPASYSAMLETGTTNGSLDFDFPVTIQGRLDRRLSTQLGSGGATVRAMTHNGGVVVTKR
ncbi:MAG: DUF4097 domain-containing protein [Gemmatimonadota bacterium]|nr:DUF4097 domain-containing protein [Gemmatimonadota bacterium]